MKRKETTPPHHPRPELKKAVKVEIREADFLSVRHGSLKKSFKKFDETIDNLEKFLKILEKKFHEVIWYIGTDILENNLTERFVFKKSGFMEVALKPEAEINAFFPAKEKAVKFAKSVRKTLKKLKAGGKIRVCE